MKLTAKGRYAVLAMTELALAKKGNLVKISHISETQKISSKYLEQILMILNHAGFVTGVRGPKGGYKLSQSPSKIRIVDVIETIEGKIEAKACTLTKGSCTGVSGRCLTHDLWDELGRQIELFLGQISLEDIIEGKVLGRSSLPRPYSGYIDAK